MFAVAYFLIAGGQPPASLLKQSGFGRYIIASFLGLRYLSEPVQMRKKRTSTASKRLIIFPYIISPLFLVFAHFYESSTLNRIIFSFFKAAERRNTGSISSFGNAEKRKKNRFKAWFGWIS